MSNTFNIRIVGLDNLIRNAENAGPKFAVMLKQGMVNATTLVQNNAKKIKVGSFKNRTGNLRRNIHKQVYGAHKGEVYVSERYGEYVEFGTRPHVILPRNKKMLAFKVGGSVVFARKVNHPGSRPYPYMEPAFRESKPEIEKQYEKITETIVKELAK